MPISPTLYSEYTNYVSVPSDSIPDPIYITESIYIANETPNSSDG